MGFAFLGLRPVVAVVLLLSLGLVLWLGLLFCGPEWVCSADVSSPAGDVVIEENGVTARIRLAVRKGLEYLHRVQNPSGSWSCNVGYKLNYRYVQMGEHEHVGVTGLACMALMAGGHVPGRGPYGQDVKEGLDFILRHQDPKTGYISYRNTRMYEHAFCTLFLAEVYGMSPERRLRRALRDAVWVIIRSQNRDGGWRYQPYPKDADISVTVSTLQALRAARNVGIAVPKKVIDRAMDYIYRSAQPDGSFKYQLVVGTRTSYALTACGVVSLMSAGEYNSVRVRNALTYLRTHRGELGWGMFHYFYGHYYAAQAFYQAGERLWREYFRWVSQEIVSQQKPDGHWEDDVGPTYATAMACLILQIPNEYLPIFQK